MESNKAHSNKVVREEGEGRKHDADLKVAIRGPKGSTIEPNLEGGAAIHFFLSLGQLHNQCIADAVNIDF